MRRTCWGLLLLVAVACSDDDPPEGHDPTRIYETFEHARVYVDQPYDFEVVTQFRADRIEDPEVTALAVVGSEVFAGTASGLFRLEGERFERVVSVPSARIVDLYGGADALWVATNTSIFEVDPSGAVLQTVTASASAVAPGPISGLYDDVLLVGDRVYVATSSGVEVRDQGGTVIDTPLTEPVRALAHDGTNVWAAAAERLVNLGDGSAIEPGVDGLPNGDLRAVAAIDGLVLTGHGIGATALAGTKKDHYHSKRWIPDEVVTAVALQSDGTRWIGTGAGVSRVRLEPTTLTEKAEVLEGFLDRHIRMEGFVTVDAFLDDPWDDTTVRRLYDNDNDGQWTETQLGAWCFAYAATGEQRFYDRARATFEVMLMEFDIPALTFEAAGKKRGFITRSLVRDDEGDVFTSKATQDNWHLQSYEGRDYYWKDNTSADEYDGHFFGLPLYYDLCAQNDEEREAIATRLASAMDYLIDNDYVLIDLDGERTEDGRWNNLAIALNGLDPCVDKHGIDGLEACIFSRHGGGWLNSIEILSYLLATWHVTGDAKYYDEYERLHTEERYGKMIPIVEDTFTVTKPAFANHSDHEMAVLSYFILLRYEPNADRREIWLRSFLDFYEAEREEHNPFQIGGLAAFTGADVDLDGAVQTLRDLPLDWRKWRYDNSHRVDAVRDVADRAQNAQFKTVFPYDEIRIALWNASPYEVVGGTSGGHLVVPMPYLIAYWMMRYYGLITLP